MMQLLDTVNAALWGAPGVGLLAAAGVWLTVRTGFFQLTRLPLWLGQTLGAILRRSPDLAQEEAGSISPLESLCTALGATIGTGSVVGVGAALASGGPGAVFWMWVMALFGMMTAYAENLLGLRYRRFWGGSWHGGPMYYLAAGLGAKPHGRALGRALAGAFALFCLLASFGIGNLTQVNAIAGSLEGAFGLSPALTGTALTAVTALVLLRGMKGVASAAGRLVPLMAAFYLAGTAFVILTHASALPAALDSILRGAFGLRAAGAAWWAAARRRPSAGGLCAAAFPARRGWARRPSPAARPPPGSPPGRGCGGSFRSLSPPFWSAP